VSSPGRKIDPPAVEALIKTLAIRHNPTYWEATKALSQIGSLKSVQALVQVLEDGIAPMVEAPVAVKKVLQVLKQKESLW
jgi:HEAT repeat protein